MPTLVRILTTLAVGACVTNAYAAITLTQHAGKDAGTTTSSSLAFASNNTAGNFVAVAIRAGRIGQTFTVTDTRGNLYRRALSLDETLDTVTLGLYYAENIASGPNTVTVSDTLTGGTLRFSIFEYAGVAASSSLDGAAVTAEGVAASASSGAVTTTANGDLILGVMSASDAATFTAGSGFTIQERVPAAPGTKLILEDQQQAAAGPIAATATIAGGNAWTAAVAAFRAGSGVSPPSADLTLAKTHAGSFTQGQTGATYTLTATNGGTGPTVGAVTVSDALPAGLTATSLLGAGWACTLSPLACTRSDVLPAGSSYPAMTLTVSVSASAPASLVNSATVGGGGESNTANDTASDPTTILGPGPATRGAWSAVRSWPIVAVHAHLLPDGDVLAWTDYTDNAGAQIWHRATDTFAPKTYATVSLFCAGHAYLSDGRMLIAGGIVGLQDDLGPRDSTIFDPVSETWSAGGLMATGRYYPTTTTLPDGRVLVSGGTTLCSTCIADNPEIYDPVTNSWTTMAASAWQPFKYYPHDYVLPDGRILLAAEDDKAISTQVLDLNTQTWTTVDPRILDGHSSVMYLPGKVMKAGKATADAPGLPAVATTYVLDMTQPSPAWQATALMEFPRSYVNLTILPDGQVLATGGGTTTDKANFATAVYEAELWSPVTKSWTTMSRSQTPRLYHSTALLLPDATVLVAGGGRENGRSQPDPKDQANAEIFSPPYLFRGPRPVISSAPSVLQYGTPFSVATPDAARIGSVSLIALSSVTHSFNMNQRFVPLTFQSAGGSLNVQAPPNGNIVPPGPYMLFLVDTTGVPSVAAMVRVPAPGLAGVPDLTLLKTHAGAFTPGQVGATYTLTATNGGTGPTVGAVTVSDALPAGLTATSLSGAGWGCTLSPLACTRSDVLPAGSSYPAMTLTVNVSASAPTSLVNLATVGGGGESNTANDTASDPTTIGSGGGPGAITLAQHAGKDAGTTTSSSLAFASNNTAGNFVAVAIRAGRIGQTFTVTDTRGNLYRRALSLDETLDTVTLGLYYAENIASGPNTVTVSDTLTGGTLRFSIFEYAGVAASSSLDGAAVTAEGVAASASSGAVTTTANGDLILGVMSASDAATFTAGSGFTIQERVPAAPGTKLILEDQQQAAAGPIAATATIAGGNAWTAAVAAFRAGSGVSPPSADLTLAKTHAGSFTQGQTGATYTLTATNGGTGPTVGAVTVSDALPAGLTATSLLGAGWACTLSPLACTRSDVLPAGSSYPAMTLTVSVSASAPASLVNSATVGGGGESNTANDTASDPTTIGSGGVPGAITLAQHAGKDAGTTTSSSLAFASNNTAGNFVAVAIRAGRIGQTFTVTDTRGNTYRRAVQFDETLDTVTMGLYYAENIPAGPNMVTVTDTLTGGTLRFAIFEYAGVATSNSLDGPAVIAEGVATSASSGPVTTTTNGDLILGVFTTSDEATHTAGGGFTVQERVPVAPNTKLAVLDQQQATAGPIAATATVVGGLPWTAAAAAFRAAGGPAPN